MSHNIEYASYPESVDKKAVQAEWDDYAAHEDWQEGCTGLLRTIEWKDKIFDSREEAMAWIERNETYNYWQVAVKYRHYPELKKSKALTDAETLTETWYNKYRSLDAVKYTATVKSAFVGCKKCGSKISTAYFSGSFCPICRSDLRSDTTLNQIARAKELYEKYKARTDTERKKCQAAQTKNAKIMWLVKIEYHT